jgi:hypothetical protein
MTSRLFLGCLVGAALSAGSAHAQGIVSKYPPLSPEEAVRVLRASHSIADLTDYHSPGEGPTVVIMGSSTTPWTWPDDAIGPRPLSNDPGWLNPYDMYYGPGYYNGYSNGYYAPRTDRMHDRTRRSEAKPAPPPPPPRHVVMPAVGGGAGTHRR